MFWSTTLRSSASAADVVDLVRQHVGHRDELAAAMRADVVEGPERAVVLPEDDDRLVGGALIFVPLILALHRQAWNQRRE